MMFWYGCKAFKFLLMFLLKTFFMLSLGDCSCLSRLLGEPPMSSLHTMSDSSLRGVPSFAIFRGLFWRAGESRPYSWGGLVPLNGRFYGMIEHWERFLTLNVCYEVFEDGSNKDSTLMLGPTSKLAGICCK